MIISSNSQGVSQKKNLSLRGKKILQVLPALDIGGVEVGTVQIAKALMACGAEAHVVSAGGCLEKELTSMGAYVHRLPLASKNPFTLMCNAQSLRTLIEHEGIDLVHVRSRAPAWSVYWALKEHAVPWLTTFHGTYNFKSKLKKKYNSVMLRGRRVIAISHFIKHHIEQHYGSLIEPQNIHVIHRGVDCAQFSPETLTDDECITFRKTHGIPHDASLIVMPARLTLWKGQKIFIEALAGIKELNFYALIVGPSKNKTVYRQDLMNLIKQHQLEHRVQLIERVDPVRLLYGAADLVVHASIEPEGFGRTLIEAHSSGKVVIASNLGAPPEIVEEGVTGFLTPPGDPHALRDAIEAYFQMDEKVRLHMGLKARERAQTYFSQGLMCDKTLEVYAELLKG